MMTDFFVSGNRVTVRFAADGMGGLSSEYTLGESVRGLVVAGRGEHTSGADGSASEARGILHTFCLYGFKHGDVVFFRGHLYKISSDAIPCPEQALDNSWESFHVDEINAEVSR